MNWFKNLKKWQKGGLIGCAVGIILASIILLSPQSIEEWLYNLHIALFFGAFLILALLYSIESIPINVDYVGWVFVVIFYGGLGALFGRFQQMANPTWKWSLTALLALFLILLYVSGFFITALSYNP